MKIWAIADLHLCFGAPNKKMDVFGPSWLNYLSRIKENWEKVVSPEDLVLIAGDISWAMQLEEAMKDLHWIAALPGSKVLLKGNHDYWWPSNQKLKKALPPSIHFVNHTQSYTVEALTIGGTRLWDTEEYSFKECIHFVENPFCKKPQGDPTKKEEIYSRELGRLRLSLEHLDPKATFRICMTHYPPIGIDLNKSRASEILEAFGVHVAIFGHLHSLKKGLHPFGKKNEIRYLLTSADYLDFKPMLVEDLSATSF